MKAFLLTIVLALSVNAADKAAKAKTAAKVVTQVKTIESVKSENIEFKAADGKTEFLAVGKPAMIKINGEAQGAEGTLTAVKNTVSGLLTVDLTKLTTKIDLRDDHLKNKYLEVVKFPTATLEFINLELPTEVAKLTDVVTTVPFKGKFTLHGKSSEVTGTANISRNAQTVSTQAEFTFKITDHLDTLPTWLGVKVAESVTVKAGLKGTAK